MDAGAPSGDARKAGSSDYAAQAPVKNNKFQCRVDGCKRHLSREKTYFRRYRCCMSHSKQPAVMVDGQVRRWCQQCCCFHELSAFDGDKRNCRERLAMHNDRRNKRKNDPAATRQPSSRVAAIANAQEAAAATEADAAQRGSRSHGDGGGARPGRVSKTPTSLQSALAQGAPLSGDRSLDLSAFAGNGHHSLEAFGNGGAHAAASSLEHPAKRQRQEPSTMGRGLGRTVSQPEHNQLAIQNAIMTLFASGGRAASYADAAAAAAAAQSLHNHARPMCTEALLAAAHSQAAAAAQPPPPANGFSPARQFAAHHREAAPAHPFGLAGAATAAAGGRAPQLAQLPPLQQALLAQALQQQAQQQGLQQLHDLQKPAHLPQHRGPAPTLEQLLLAGRELSLGFARPDCPGSQGDMAMAQRSLSHTCSRLSSDTVADAALFRSISGGTAAVSSLLGDRAATGGDRATSSPAVAVPIPLRPTPIAAGLTLGAAFGCLAHSPPAAGAIPSATAPAASAFSAPAPLMSSAFSAAATTSAFFVVPQPPLPAAAGPAAGAHPLAAAMQLAATTRGPEAASGTLPNHVLLTMMPHAADMAADFRLQLQQRHLQQAQLLQQDGMATTPPRLHAAAAQAAAAAAAQKPVARSVQRQSGAGAFAGLASQQWAAIVRGASVASPVRSALQAVRWSPEVELGSRRWWERRLGALLLLLRFAAAGAVPIGLYQGLLALTEMSLRLALAVKA